MAELARIFHVLQLLCDRKSIKTGSYDSKEIKICSWIATGVPHLEKVGRLSLLSTSEDPARHKPKDRESIIPQTEPGFGSAAGIPRAAVPSQGSSRGCSTRSPALGAAGEAGLCCRQGSDLRAQTTPALTQLHREQGWFVGNAVLGEPEEQNVCSSKRTVPAPAAEALSSQPAEQVKGQQCPARTCSCCSQTQQSPAPPHPALLPPSQQSPGKHS